MRVTEKEFDVTNFTSKYLVEAFQSSVDSFARL